MRDSEPQPRRKPKGTFSLQAVSNASMDLILEISIFTRCFIFYFLLLFSHCLLASGKTLEIKEINRETIPLAKSKAPYTE